MGNGTECAVESEFLPAAHRQSHGSSHFCRSRRETGGVLWQHPAVLGVTDHLAAHRTRRTESPSPPGALITDNTMNRGAMDQTICADPLVSRPANYRRMSGLPAAAVPEHSRIMLQIATIGTQWKRSTVPIKPFGREQRRPAGCPPNVLWQGSSGWPEVRRGRPATGPGRRDRSGGGPGSDGPRTAA